VAERDFLHIGLHRNLFIIGWPNWPYVWWFICPSL